MFQLSHIHTPKTYIPTDYTPGVLELLEGLMNPRKYDQESMVWAYPAVVGKTYKQMAWDILESGAVPMGVFRYPHLDSGARLSYGEICYLAFSYVFAL